jgi:hypothetical protein
MSCKGVLIHEYAPKTCKVSGHMPTSTQANTHIHTHIQIRANERRAALQNTQSTNPETKTQHVYPAGFEHSCLALWQIPFPTRFIASELAAKQNT